MRKKLFIQCSSLVKKDAVRHKSIDGVEHIIISSYTLPDGIVMNGGLYPADEVAKSFHTLERTLAPVEHPMDSDGRYISATDPIAINNFYAGAYNTNVVQEDGRIKIEKTVNVQEALKSEKGKHLLSRINEVETNENPRPIHTSVGVYLEREELSSPVIQINGPSKGQEYSWIARDLVFDHDAILLDSVGAAQPSQGVGMAVNALGDSIDSESFNLVEDDGEVQSFDERELSVRDALERMSIKFDWIEKMFPDNVIFYAGDMYFEVPYIVDDQGIASIVGLPMPVDRKVTFNPKVNQKGDDMLKEAIINALKEANIETNDLDDTALFTAYNELQANSFVSDGDNAGKDTAAIAELLANALSPITSKLESLEVQINNSSKEELETMAKMVSENDLYPNMDEATLKTLPIATLKAMAANCQSSQGLPLTIVNGARPVAAVYDMPE